MGLTAERLAKFVGGDLEIRDYEGRRLGDTGGILRGPLEGVEVNWSGLTIRFGWVARNASRNARNPADNWTIADQKKEQRTSLDTFTEQEDLAETGHVRLNSPIHGLVLIFHPPGDNLKPSQVAGHPGAPPT